MREGHPKLLESESYKSSNNNREIHKNQSIPEV